MGDLKVRRINNIIHGAPLKQDINQDGLGRYIFTLIRNNAKKILQVNAITGEEESYESFNQKCIRVALELQIRGIKEDDVVLQLSENSMLTMIPIVATLYLNAIPATFDPSMSLCDVIRLIKAIQPRVVFTINESLEMIQQALIDASITVHVILMETVSNKNNIPTILDFFLPHPTENEFIPNIVADSKKTALILCSSGTTGLSKPIMCSHFALLYTITGQLMCGYDCSVTMHYNSLHWISGYILSLFTFINGGKKIICRTFDPITALEYFEKYKVGTVLLPTTLIRRFSKEHKKEFKNTYPKYIIYGGSAATTETIKKINSYFPNSNAYFVYGLTEVGGFITGYTSEFHNFFKEKPGSICLPIPGVSVKIADMESGRALPPNQKGEIRLFTKGFFNGYGNFSIEDCYDEEGFLKTGDIGYYDEDNCLYMTDRSKEMFKYQSHHIIPNYLESILYKHAAVQEALVIGIPNEEDGHHPMAVVVLHENFGTVKEIDIQEFVNERVLEREKLRAGVHIVKKLPKTSSGKIMRNHIRDLIISGKSSELQ